jgi:Flp pilus assembly protein TadG
MMSFWRSRKGNIAMIAALASPLILGGAAFGADTTYWYFRDLELQAAADAAAHAAAIEMRAGRSETVVRAAALREGQSNGFDSSKGTMVVNTPPQSGAYQQPKAVEVLLTERQERFFSALFSNSDVVAGARAVAIYESSSRACVLALDPSAPRAASVSGSASLTLHGCTLMANSVAADAVYMGGSSSLTTPCVISVGGVAANANLSMSECEVPVTQAPPVADPFASLPEPVGSGACKNDNLATLQPGRYCNGLNLKGTVHLAPGVYVIESGTFRTNANAQITGDGVTIYLAEGVDTHFNGNAEIDLRAPTSGTYSGILFFGARDTSGEDHTFNGTADSSLTGALYFPSDAVEYSGNFSGDNGCTQVIGRTVSWTGNATVEVDCSAFGMATLPAAQLIKTVE